MNTSRIAAAAMAAALLLLCPSPADASEDREAEEQPAAEYRRNDEPQPDRERRDLKSTERQSGGGESPKVIDQERPAMPIPIPGVGRHESGETIYS